jgi:hypothetical protein
MGRQFLGKFLSHIDKSQSIFATLADRQIQLKEEFATFRKLKTQRYVTNAFQIKFVTS